MRRRQLAPLLLVVLLLAACQASAPIRPGAYNRLDSDAYGTLLVTQASIEKAKTEASGRAEVIAVNHVSVAYNAVEAAYRLYHDELKAGGHPDPGTLAVDVGAVLASATALLVTFHPQEPTPP